MIRIKILFCWILRFPQINCRNYMLPLAILFSLIILSWPMFAPRRERVMQTVSIDDKLFESPKIDTITFDEYAESLSKRYNSPNEAMYRMLVFSQNTKLITSHNIAAGQNLGKNKLTYTMEINQFSDLTEKEFREIYTRTYPTSKAVVEKTKQVIEAGQTPGHVPCVGCRDPSNKRLVIDPSKATPSALDLQILKIVQESNLKKQESATELDELLEKLKQQDHATFTQSVNFDTTFPDIDISNIEISTALNTNIKPPIETTMPSDIKTRLLQATSIPQIIQIDWTSVSGSIKFQGVCGSCYAFATADAVSAMYSLFKFDFNVPLSVQQIVDCPINGLTFGCEGGFLEGAYAYMQTNGITINFQYKYTGIVQTCKVNNGNFKVKEFNTLTQGDCPNLIEELKKKPIAVGIAGYRLKFYSSGVFDDCNSYIDHAVLLVGYKSGLGWKIKNTWGTTWGMNGYAWIKEGDTCGMCQNAVSATIAQEPVAKSAAKADGGAPVVPQKIVPNIYQMLSVLEARSGQQKEAQQAVKPVVPTPGVIAQPAIGRQ